MGGGYGLLHGAVRNLLTSLRVPVLDSAECDLKKLEDNVTVIRSLISGAEEKEDVSPHLIEAIKDVVYYAEDIVDESLVELRRSEMKQVNCFVTAYFKFKRKRKLGLGVEKVATKLEDMDKQMSLNRLSEYVHRPISSNPRDLTCSFVFEDEIIGRDGDLKSIIGLLLDPQVEEDVSVVCIVGMGGLGKTTLAQLVYNDDCLKKAFELRFWVCVSSDFSVSAILGKILHLASDFYYPSHDSTHSLDLLLYKVQQVLRGKRYLLVLDDLWCEDPTLLRDLLKIPGATGSRILVTTRSAKTAQLLHSRPYYLQGLSEEQSWELFTRCAFDRHTSSSRPDFVDIGKTIAKQCSNVPLAIRTVGGLLYGQDKSKWLSVLKSRVPEYPYTVMSILKLSYHALEPSLKSCFTYCALFPKGFEIQKEMLISLWMAQGYIDHDYDTEQECGGEQCFSMLLQRCFFGDVKMDEYGEIISCKLHDLMHDLAQEAAGNEISVLNSLKRNLEPNTYHIFQDGGGFEGMFINTKLRSYLQDSLKRHSPSNIELSNRMHLRVLDLHNLGIESLPHSIGTLKLLRYLDLSCNDSLTVLPSSLTKLYNLQTLKLKDCVRLNELPKDFSNLISLRYLDICNCGLTCMPLGMDKLTRLCVLTGFVVAESDLVRRQSAGQLRDLQALVNLKGCLDISIPCNAEIADNHSKERYLSRMKDIKQLSVNFKATHPGECSETNTMHKNWLETLLPHRELKGLMLNRYQGDRIFWQGTQDDWTTLLPMLVKIELVSCHWLQQIPLLSKLPHLRSLVLADLTRLEFMEDENGWSAETSKSGSLNIVEPIFYPSLKSLCILNLSELKGWWRGVGWGDDQLVNHRNSCQPLFPCLSELLIRVCPKLTSFPLCPHVDTLRLSELNEMLQIIVVKPDMELVELDNINHLSSLSTRYLVKIHIRRALELKHLSEVGVVFKSCSSLQILTIEDCPNLSHLSGGLKHLTVLESDEDDNNDDIFWKSLQQSLCVLELVKLGNLSNLPSGMQYLTALQTLNIYDCGLRCLPDWIGSLSSLRCLRIICCFYLKSLPTEMMKLCFLQELEIKGSPELIERCRGPMGEDWPIINFIPVISLSVENDQQFSKGASEFEPSWLIS